MAHHTVISYGILKSTAKAELHILETVGPQGIQVEREVWLPKSVILNKKVVDDDGYTVTIMTIPAWKGNQINRQLPYGWVGSAEAA